MVQVVSCRPRAAHETVARSAADAAPCSLVELAERFQNPVKVDPGPLLDAYLVDNGKRRSALELLEAQLGRTRQADAKGANFSHEVIERGLRSRFAVFDAAKDGTMRMESFAKLLQLLKLDLTDEEIVEETKLVRVDADARIDYVDFVKWWLSTQ